MEAEPNKELNSIENRKFSLLKLKLEAHFVYNRVIFKVLPQMGKSEPAPTIAPWRTDGKWLGNNFLLGSSSLANRGN